MKFYSTNCFHRKEGQSHKNNLSSHSKQLENEEQNKPVVEGGKRRAETDEIENRYTIQNVNETKAFI